MTNFVSVATSAARYQDISLNPQKLAGQCAKLKCCINFEVDGYVEASKKLPPRDVRLETKDNTYFHFKTDIFKREITYSTDKQIAANLVTLSAERVFEVMALNKNGVRPEKLLPDEDQREKEMSAYGDIIGQDSVSRFDKKKKKRRDGKGGNKQQQEGGGNQQRAEGGGQRQGGNGKERRNGNRKGEQQRQGGDQQPQAPREAKVDQPRQNGGEPHQPQERQGENRRQNNNRRKGGGNRGANNRESQGNDRRQEKNTGGDNGSQQQ